MAANRRSNPKNAVDAVARRRKTAAKREVGAILGRRHIREYVEAENSRSERCIKDFQAAVGGNCIFRVKGSSGFLLAEFLPALVISLLIFGSVCSIFVIMDRNAAYQDHTQRSRQTLQASMCRMIVDLRTTGCNPWGISPFTGFVPDPSNEGKGNEVLLRFDRRGAKSGSLPDGDINDPDEQILYEWDSADRVLQRNNQPMALNVVENAGKTPVFDQLIIGDQVLLSVTLTIRPPGQERSVALSTKVWLRNRI